MLDARGQSVLNVVYEAAVDVSRWPMALDAVCDAIGARAIMLLLRDPEPPHRDHLLLSSVYRKFSRSAWGFYFDMRLRHFQAGDWDRLRKAPGLALIPDSLNPDEANDLDARPDHRFLRKRLGIQRRVSARLSTDPLRLDALSIALPTGRSGLSEKEHARATALLPHLAKSIENSHRFGTFRDESEPPVSLADLPYGAALALANGSLALENADASRILSQGDGFKRVPEGNFHCDRAPQSARLHAAIVEACQTARGLAAVADHHIDVERASGRSAYLVEVTPFSDAGARIGPSPVAALVTLIDPDALQFLPVERFAELCGFGTADTTLCCGLALGLRPSDIAEQMSLPERQIIQKLQEMMLRLGVKDRAALIRMILRALPPTG